MKSIHLRFLTFILLGAFICTGTYAQEQTKTKKKSKFGSFIRNVGEATTGINMSDETFVSLNIDAQKMIEIGVVSCIGDSKTQTVTLTLYVKAKADGTQTDLGKSCGHNGNDNCVTAYDAKGNTYSGTEVGEYTKIGSKENPTGIPVQYQFVFSDIPATLKQIEVVMVEFYTLNPNNHLGSNMSSVNPIQIRNIPIEWGTAAE